MSFSPLDYLQHILDEVNFLFERAVLRSTRRLVGTSWLAPRVAVDSWVSPDERFDDSLAGLWFKGEFAPVAFLACWRFKGDSHA